MIIKIQIFALVILALCMPLGNLQAEEISQLQVGLGHGPQVRKEFQNQYNSSIDLSYNFYRYRFESSPRWSLLVGVGYSYLDSNTPENNKVHVGSILPTLRYDFEAQENYQVFIHVTAGPSIMSSNSLGYQYQGSRFLFNDFIGVGVRFGQQQEWELSWAWRHLSNAAFFMPNPGFDVPFSFHLGKKL